METGAVTAPGSLSRAVILARRAVREFPACFWTRGPEAPIETSEDVALIVRRLRQNGPARAWRAATEIEQCL